MPTFGTFTDSRDGHVYKTVLMPDGKWWAAENLAWAGAGVDYNNDPANRAIYGRLYTYSEASTGCPTGTRLAGQSEVIALIAACGGDTTAGRNLKAVSSYWDTNTGTDIYGFRALPGGKALYGFADLGTHANFWGLTPGSDTAFAFYFWGEVPDAYTGFRDVNLALSVRFIVDSGNVPDVTPQPSIYPPQGTYQGVQLVVLKSSQSLPIRYTLDGSEPTISSPLYVGPIPVYQDTQIKAAAFYGNMPSDTVTASYTITNGILVKIPSYRDRVLPYLLEQYKGDNT